jgi:hypothetical protein
MTDSLSKLLLANRLDPDAFIAITSNESIFRGELPAGHIMQTWIDLAKAAHETKYWPIIRGGSGDVDEQIEADAEATLVNVPTGTIREILKPLIEERRQSLADVMPEFAHATDMDDLARLADASGVYSFSGDEPSAQAWPTEAPELVSLHTIKELKGRPAVVMLINVEHSSDVPAHLGFGGWNECPSPELQVAVLREWRKEYNAVPACITNDVLECVVVKRPQTEAEAIKLAAEQWIFCEDIVSQGTELVRNLGMELWRSPNWFFWWD